MTQMLRTGALPLLAGGEQSSAAPMGAGPGGAIRLRNALIVGPGALVQQPDILLAAFGGKAAIDAFTGPNGTILSAHTADSGFGWVASGLGLNAQIQTNELQFITGLGIGTPNRLFVSNHFTVYGDWLRPTDTTANVYAGFRVRGPGATSIVGWGRTDANNVVFYVDSQVVNASVPWAVGARLRWGVTIDGTQFTVWREPYLGGARTVIGTVTVVTPYTQADALIEIFTAAVGASTNILLDNFNVNPGQEGHAVVGIFPFEQQGGASAASAGVVFVYDKVAQVILLAQMGEDLSNLRYLDGYTAYTQAYPPQVTGFEMFGKFYATEYARQTAANRKGMLVFDPAGAGTITIPTFVLNGGAAASLKFRGICKHRGATILGWGYQDEVTPTGEHILRYCKYGTPDTWVPDATEVTAGQIPVGTLNVPIIGCAQSGQYTVIGKQNEIFILDGDYSSQFYLRPIGKANGPISTAGICSTGDIAVWMSANGPAVSVQGAAVELIGVDQVTRRFLSYMDLANAACAYDSRNSRVGFGLRRKYDDAGDPVSSSYLSEILWWDHVRNVFYPGDVPRQFWCLGTTKGTDLNLPGPTGVVSAITAASVTSHSAKVSWTAGDTSPDVTFIVQVRPNGSATWQDAVTTGQAIYTATVQDLSPSQAYDVRIAQVRNSQTSAYVESLSLFTTGVTGAVADPTTVTVEEFGFQVDELKNRRYGQVRCKFAGRLANSDVQVVLYRNTANTTVGAQRVASGRYANSRSGPASGEIVDPALILAGTVYYYWLREENPVTALNSAYVQASPAPITVYGRPV